MASKYVCRLHHRCLKDCSVVKDHAIKYSWQDSNLQHHRLRGGYSAIELQEHAVGPEGVEPSPCGLKDRYAAITPRPLEWAGVTFPSKCSGHVGLSPSGLFSIPSRGGGSRTHHLEFPKLAEHPAPSPRPYLSSVARRGIERLAPA